MVIWSGRFFLASLPSMMDFAVRKVVGGMKRRDASDSSIELCSSTDGSWTRIDRMLGKLPKCEPPRRSGIGYFLAVNATVSGL